METKYPKVNTDAIALAVGKRFPQVTSCQYKSIIYIEPRVYDLDLEDIIEVGILLCRQWDAATVTSPDVRDSVHMRLRMIVGVRNLLPEFIVDGEEWIPEPENEDKEAKDED